MATGHQELFRKHVRGRRARERAAREHLPDGEMEARAMAFRDWRRARYRYRTAAEELDDKKVSLKSRSAPWRQLCGIRAERAPTAQSASHEGAACPVR